nr:MAG TPA: hypothetical protein [Caudoviricetes sp.]
MIRSISTFNFKVLSIGLIFKCSNRYIYCWAIFKFYFFTIFYCCIWYYFICPIYKNIKIIF